MMERERYEWRRWLLGNRRRVHRNVNTITNLNFAIWFSEGHMEDRVWAEKKGLKDILLRIEFFWIHSLFSFKGCGTIDESGKTDV